MPIKNVLKSYQPNTFYHIYNASIEGRELFTSPQDYHTFLDFLDQSLTPPKTKEELKQAITINGNTFKGSPRQPINLYGQLELHAFALMPGHFHLLVKQVKANGIETFMRSLGTRYVMYYNKTHQRKGPLFQGTYKALDVKEEYKLLHLTRFIHQQVVSHHGVISLYSSYPAYTGSHPMPFVTTDAITAMLDRDSFLKSLNPTYSHFIENFQEDSAKILGPLTLVQ